MLIYAITKKINIDRVRHIYISKLQASTTVKLNDHDAMFDHLYQVNIYTLG